MHTPLVLHHTFSMLNYDIHSKNDSMYNTPPTNAWYLAGLVSKWIKKQGGLEAIGEINKCKSESLYAVIDASDLYKNTATLLYTRRSSKYYINKYSNYLLWVSVNKRSVSTHPYNVKYSLGERC